MDTAKGYEEEHQRTVLPTLTQGHTYTGSRVPYLLEACPRDPQMGVVPHEGPLASSLS